MKFNISFTLVLLLAAANVFGQERDDRVGNSRSSRPGSRRIPSSDSESLRSRPTSELDRPKSEFDRSESKVDRPTSEFDRPKSEFDRSNSRVDRPSSEFDRPKSGFDRPKSEFDRSNSKVDRPSSEFDRPKSEFDRPRTEFDRPTSNFDRNERPEKHSEKTSFEEHSKVDSIDSKTSSSKENVHVEEEHDRFGDSNRLSSTKTENLVSESKVKSEEKTTKFSKTSTDERTGFNPELKRPIDEVSPFSPGKSRDESFVDEHLSGVDVKVPSRRPSSEFSRPPVTEEVRPGKVVVPVSSKLSDYDVFVENRLHLTGSILLARNKQSFVNTVDYGVKNGRWNKPKSDLVKPLFNDDLNFIAPHNVAVLYVSTLNSFNVRETFANFTIPFKGKTFPLDFDVEVILPDTLRHVLQNEDLKLYFFVYIYDTESHFESFVPEGTCQILLQSTNRLFQRLEVFVRANGLELRGVFDGLYGEKFIKPGTSFQILIIAEEFINRFVGVKVDYVSQIIINDIPSMYPLAFNGLVPHQRLKVGVRYYAIAYIFEDGFERLLTPVPILVINENRVIVTTEFSIKVIPNPFIMFGTITRSMPGNFYFERDSSIILNLYQVDAKVPPISFRLSSTQKLPQDIQVNLSQAISFDPSRRYEVLASIVNRNNEIYMTSSQRILLDQTSSRFTVAVEDLYRHVRINLRSSYNQPLTFIRGSVATVIVTETTEVTHAPLFKIEFDPTELKSDGYLLKVPVKSISRVATAYLMLFVNNTDIITHISKVLFISDFQPPPFNIDLPVISLSLLRGQILDSENNPSQWSSSAYAVIDLVDDDGIKSDKRLIVQTWKIYLEREFPINFEVHVDFSRLIPGHRYSLISNIETRPGFFEYESVSSFPVFVPRTPIEDNIRLMVKSVKVSHIVSGIVYLDSVQQYLSKHGEVVVYLSSNQILTKPDIIFESRIQVESRSTMVNFTMEVPLNLIDMNGIYYFIVQYVSSGQVIIAPSQVFSYTPRNGPTVILRLSKSEQIEVTGEIVSTGGQLILPEGSNLLLQITDSQFGATPQIYSQLVLPASATNLYRFTLYFDSILVPRNATVYLRTSIMYKDHLILGMPRPVPIQIQQNVVWNLVLTIDLPTLLIGHITMVGEKFTLTSDYEAYVQIVIGGTKTVLSSTRVRLDGSWPQLFRVEVDNHYFLEHSRLEAIALVKNCKEEPIFHSVSPIRVHPRLNLELDLQIVPYDSSLLKKLSSESRIETSVGYGFWSFSLRGTSSFEGNRAVATLDASFKPSF